MSAWQPKPIDEATLRRLYDLARMPPTSANTQPARYVFVKSADAKARLLECVSRGNVDKTRGAPVTAIVAYDLEFHAHMARTFPIRPEAQKRFASFPEPARDAFLMQNASLQAGYLILAARALGIDCGPMGGFDKEKTDAAFLAGTKWKSILLVNLGYGDDKDLHPRLPRLEFDEVCKIV